jgi:hypothetical protein
MKEFKIRIPEPCHEDWNGMTKNEQGRHCQACSKTVIDFTDKEPEEIEAYLTANASTKLCGRFKTTQLDKSYYFKVDLNSIPANLGLLRSFRLAIVLVFLGTLFSCTNYNNQKVLGEIEPSYTTVGMLVAPPIEPKDTLVNKIESIVTESCETLMMGDIAVEEPLEMQGKMVIDYPIIVDTNQVKNENLKSDTTVTIIPQPVILQVKKDSIKGIKAAEQQEKEPLQFTVYPNQSNGSFELSYQLKRNSSVEARLFDLNGKLIKVLFSQQQQYAGNYTIAVNETQLQTGLYLVELYSNGTKETKKIIISN